MRATSSAIYHEGKTLFFSQLPLPAQGGEGAVGFQGGDGAVEFVFQLCVAEVDGQRFAGTGELEGVAAHGLALEAGQFEDLVGHGHVHEGEIAAAGDDVP